MRLTFNQRNDCSLSDLWYAFSYYRKNFFFLFHIQFLLNHCSHSRQLTTFFSFPTENTPKSDCIVKASIFASQWWRSTIAVTMPVTVHSHADPFTLLCTNVKVSFNQANSIIELSEKPIGLAYYSADQCNQMIRCEQAASLLFETSTQA